MRSFLQKNRKIIGLICVISVFFSCLTVCPKRAQAAIILSADNDGNITWEREPTMATTGIRWETAGYLIYTAKTPDGDPKSSGLPFARIETGNDHVKTVTSYDPARGKYISKSIVSADYIKKAITGNKELYAAFLKNVAAGNNTIYLNAFFRVYKLDNGKKTILKDNIYSRNEMKKAQNWSNPKEWDTGRGYYNVKVEYKVTGNAYVLLEDSYGNRLKDPYLVFNDEKTAYVGDTVNVNLPYEVVSGGKVYTLYRSYYYENTDATEKKDDIKYSKDKEKALTKTFKLGLRNSVVVGRYKEKAEDEGSAESVEAELCDPKTSVQIKSDVFEVSRGIPGEEEVYLKAETDRYIYGYRLDNKTGIMNYTTYGKITWKLSYTTSDGHMSMTHSDKVEVLYPVTISRKYSYWEIGSLEVYVPKEVSAKNEAVSGEALSGRFNSSDHPVVDFKHYEDIYDHVKKPDRAETIIDLGSRVHYDAVPPEISVFEEVNAAVGECTVKSDMLVIDGVTILTGKSGLIYGDAPAEGPVSPGKTETRGDIKMTDPVKANELYLSEGEVIYTRAAEIKGSGPDEIALKIDDINPVILHTPVVVKGSIKDASRFCELVSPGTGLFQLVLDRYFSVSLSNFGPHRALPGYGTRDYGNYSVANEVCFPFDVYEGERLVAEGTYIGLDTERTFYIPRSVKEGDYTIKFRSVSKNAYPNDSAGKEEMYANLEMSEYTAIDLIDVHVSGRLYDLKLTEINGAGLDIPIGDRDRNGENKKKCIRAPLVYGDLNLPYSSGVLKKGYFFDYSVTTMGDYYGENFGIVIEPSFYVISRDGKSRIPVDIYRSDACGTSPIYLSNEGTGVSADKRIVTWSGTYNLPQEFYVLPKGFDYNGFLSEKGMITGHEPVFIKKGYLLICFNVFALKDGIKHLTLSGGNCRMWELQDGVKSKTDIYGNRFDFLNGDFIIYDLERRLEEDTNPVCIY